MNPFSPERTALTRFTPTAPQHTVEEIESTSTSTTPHTLITLAPVHHVGPATPFSDTPVVLPRRLTAEYNKFCDLQSMAHHRACCPKDLFEYPTAATLSDMDCDTMIIPETMQGSTYYNPLFINLDERKEVQETGNISRLRSLYSTVSSEGGREKRQLGLAIAGGSMFGFAVNSVLNFFGYSTTTTEDVKHINANQQHLAQVEKHVEMAEEFAEQMRREAHDLENKEQMIERYLHVASALGGIFESYDRMMSGLSVLFQHRQLSPLLVERKAVTAEVRGLQHSERVRGNLLLIDPLDVWRCQLSYVVTRSLDIMVVVHIPVAKASSYRQLYQYVRTPLAFDKGSTHFFPNPPESYLLLDKDNSNPRVLPEEDLAQCKEVRAEEKFCPGLSYVLNDSPPTCLTQLHQGNSAGVLSLCPVSIVDESFVYVASLGFGKYSLYTQTEQKARVFCGSSSIRTVAFQGLVAVQVRKDCRVVGESFVLEPVVDFTSVQQLLDSIPVQFGPDLNMSNALDWGRDQGMVSSIPDSTGHTMEDLAKSWDNSLLEESHQWSFVTYVGMICGGFIALVVSFCLVKECWQCYVRRRERAGLVAMIREQMTVEMRPMLPNRAYPDLAPTAPVSTENSSV